MTGNEDVFLSLAHNDDSPDIDQFEDAREEHDDWKTRLHTLPGQFPTASASPVRSARPKSSGQLLSRKPEGFTSTAADTKHARHSSHSETPFGLAIDTSSSLRRDLFMSRSNLPSPKSDQMRFRPSQRGDMDSGSSYGRISRHKPSYSEIALSVDPRVPGNNLRNGRANARPISEYIDRLSQAAPGATGPQSSPPGSDSGDSQTAASTVWDELDELKSRIKKLEYTGRPLAPSGSSPLGQTADRPRTATTAPTTISSSPRQFRKPTATPTEVNIGGASTASTHPLLHSALAKAKTTIKPQLYRPLEATAADVLALATTTGSTGSQAAQYSTASVVNGAAVSDRQLRRKVDNMCRSITDLCIALCDSHTEEGRNPASPLSARRLQQGTPPRYPRQTTGPDDQTTQREVEPRRASRKSISRLDEFRTARGLTPVTGGSSPDSFLTAEFSPGTPKDYTSRYLTSNRSETRTKAIIPNEEGELDATERAPSRAMTELGGFRQGLAIRRDYMTTVAQRSPSLRETLAARRASINLRPEDAMSEVQAPSQSGQAPSARRLLDRDRPGGPPSEVGSTVSSARRRVSSLEPYTPSTRVSTFQPRTTSLSHRRMATES